MSDTQLPPERIWINEGFWHKMPLNVRDIEYVRADLTRVSPKQNTESGEIKELGEDAGLSCSTSRISKDMTLDADQDSELLMEMERNAMVETIQELERGRDRLLQVSRMSLQQFEFQYGQRK